jgi:hypothetical protein
VQPALRQGASALSMALDKSGKAPLIQVTIQINISLSKRKIT